MRGAILPLPNTLSWRGTQLRKHRDKFTFFTYAMKNRDSSVGIALGYGLDDLSPRVRFPTWVGNFSLRHRVQNGSGARPASYPMGTRGSFPGVKAAVA
jgi:hypothetical protein